jgi:hypothetical protein
MNEIIRKELKAISATLDSIDVSLMQIANKGAKRTTAFVSKKNVGQRLGVPSVAIDKLIHQGITSKGKSGLVEGVHYAKLSPLENNPSKFLYDVNQILLSAWDNFKYD